MIVWWILIGLVLAAVSFGVWYDTRSVAVKQRDFYRDLWRKEEEINKKLWDYIVESEDEEDEWKNNSRNKGTFFSRN